MYWLDHTVYAWIKQPFALFRVHPFHEVHRSFDVGKEDGDEFAFAFYDCFAGENTLREVSRRVIHRRLKTGGKRLRIDYWPLGTDRSMLGLARCLVGVERYTAIATKPFVCLNGGAAARTRKGEGSATLLTKLRLPAVCRPALRTLQGREQRFMHKFSPVGYIIVVGSRLT